MQDQSRKHLCYQIGDQLKKSNGDDYFLPSSVYLTLLIVDNAVYFQLDDFRLLYGSAGELKYDECCTFPLLRHQKETGLVITLKSPKQLKVPKGSIAINIRTYSSQQSLWFGSGCYQLDKASNELVQLILNSILEHEFVYSSWWLVLRHGNHVVDLLPVLFAVDLGGAFTGFGLRSVFLLSESASWRVPWAWHR